MFIEQALMIRLSKDESMSPRAQDAFGQNTAVINNSMYNAKPLLIPHINAFILSLLVREDYSAVGCYGLDRLSW